MNTIQIRSMIRVHYDDPQNGEKVEEFFGVPEGYDDLEALHMIDEIMVGITYQVIQ